MPVAVPAALLRPGAAQFQQNKLPDFIRRLEESLYRMAASLVRIALLPSNRRSCCATCRRSCRLPLLLLAAAA